MQGKFELEGPKNILQMIKGQPSREIQYAADSLQQAAKTANTTPLTLEEFKSHCQFSAGEATQEAFFKAYILQENRDTQSRANLKKVIFKANQVFAKDSKPRPVVTELAINDPLNLLSPNETITLDDTIVANVNNSIGFRSHNPVVNARAALMEYLPLAVIAGYRFDTKVVESMKYFLQATATNPFDNADTNGTLLGDRTGVNFGLLDTGKGHPSSSEEPGHKNPSGSFFGDDPFGKSRLHDYGVHAHNEKRAAEEFSKLIKTIPSKVLEDQLAKKELDPFRHALVQQEARARQSEMKASLHEGRVKLKDETVETNQNNRRNDCKC